MLILIDSTFDQFSEQTHQVIIENKLDTYIFVSFSPLALIDIQPQQSIFNFKVILILLVEHKNVVKIYQI